MTKAGRDRFFEEFPAALADDAGGIFVGAGVSVGAGYPSWVELLREIGEELGVNSGDVHDLAALAQWSVQSSGSKTRIRKVIRDNIKPDHDIPESLRIISRLPVRHIWTTNYDRLIERSFDEIRRPIDVIAAPGDLSIRARPGASRLYKMHGSIDRLDDLVISTDDYELYRSKRGAFLPLLQAHLTGMSILFVGLSFTDPNIRHVLSLIRESFTEAPPEHFAIVKPPQRKDFRTDEEYQARHTQHSLWARDLRRYGLIAVEIDDYDEVPELLRHIERRVARRRVWVSGSWPVGMKDLKISKVYDVADGVGKAVGNLDMTLVTGAGVVVGSATIAGFLDALRASGSWDLERRMIARPFPQPLEGEAPDRTQWTKLRQELARLSGTIVFVGGGNLLNGDIVLADGALQEKELAQAEGAFLLPVGATGGAAKVIADELIGSDFNSSGESALRPTDAELISLSDESLDANALVVIVKKILRRVSKK